MSNTNNGGSAFPHWDATAMHRIGAAAANGVEGRGEKEAAYIAATAQATQGLTKLEYFMAHVDPPSDLINSALIVAGRQGISGEAAMMLLADFKYETAKAMLARIERGDE
jgi:hypothetical protein